LHNIFLWSICFFIALTLSTFIHELGHGLSNLLYGRRVSTGFSKVGNFGKRPSSNDFRTNYFEESYILYDLGVIITLILALSFYTLLRVTHNPYLVTIIGSFAYSNSLLRLIPCANSIYGLVRRGKPNMEDEVGMGIALSSKVRIPLIQYIPLLISLSISIYTLNGTIGLLSQKLRGFLAIDSYFVIASIIILLVNSQFLEWLDERYRVNWG